MTPRWMIFCEAEADFRTAETLIDEVLLLRCASWVKDLYEQDPSFVRTWHHSEGRAWFDVHRIYDLAASLGVRLGYGHFDGRPGAPGARMLDTIFRIRREMLRRAAREFTLDAVVLVWDMDQQGRQRRAGLEQAAGDDNALAGAALVLGLPDPMRETWVVAGFVPLDDDETARLAAARQELGFAPEQEPHRLVASDEAAKLHAKRVLRDVLGVRTWERELRCLRIPDEPARARLASSGKDCGLEAFLQSIEAKLVRQIDPAVRPGSEDTPR